VNETVQARAADRPAAEPAAVTEDVLIILPVRNTVLFPQVVLPIAIKRERSVAAAQEAVKAGRKVGLLLQRDPEQDDPPADALHTIGTIASIVRYVTAADGTHHLICQGEQRFSVLDFVSRDPFMVARITAHPESTELNPEIEARAQAVRPRQIGLRERQIGLAEPSRRKADGNAKRPLGRGIGHLPDGASKPCQSRLAGPFHDPPVSKGEEFIQHGSLMAFFGNRRRRRISLMCRESTSETAASADSQAHRSRRSPSRHQPRLSPGHRPDR